MSTRKERDRVARRRVEVATYRESYAPREIDGETTLSWLIGNVKIPKDPRKRKTFGEKSPLHHDRFALTASALDDAVLLHCKHRIGRRVGGLRDANKLRAVCEIIGVDPSAAEAADFY